MIDALLAFAGACAWASVLWFYGRAEYREPRWRYLLLLTIACALCFWFVPWLGWLLAAALHHIALQQGFEFPRRAAWTMTLSMLAVYFAVRLLFAFAGPPPPPV